MQHRPAAVRRRYSAAAILGIVAVLVAACGGAAEEPEAEPAAAGSAAADDAPAEGEAPEQDAAAEEDAAPLQVVATTSILGDIVASIAGDAAEVTVLIGPGIDPHAYQPAASDAAMMREADLVVASGLQLEESLVSVLDAAVEDGVNVLELAEQLDPIEFDGDDDHAHDDDAHGPEDPHVWWDPVRMADGARIIAAELAAMDAERPAAEWEAKGERYAAELLAVHEELEQLFAAIPTEDRVLVTNHDALGYLADRYGFEVLATVIPGASTTVEQDARGFAELIETVEQAGVQVVFAENTDSTRLAEQLASEVLGRSDLELEVVRIYTDALGEPGSGAETYVGMLRTTAGLIVDALT